MALAWDKYESGKTVDGEKPRNSRCCSEPSESSLNTCRSPSSSTCTFQNNFFVCKLHDLFFESTSSSVNVSILGNPSLIAGGTEIGSSAGASI
jgi:hypothetical protein